MSWSSDFFSENRHRLNEHLKGGLVIMGGHINMQRRNDMAYPFTQDANFWYLTGITAPGWKMIYDGVRGKTWLIRPDTDDTYRVFEGYLSDEQACAISGADEVVRVTEQENLLRNLVRKHSQIYTMDPRQHAIHTDIVLNPVHAEVYRMVERIFAGVLDITAYLRALRAIKTNQEIAAIRQAVELTIDTFSEVQKSLSTYKYEYEIEAEFTRLFRRKNAIHAYDPIVASGSNACTLHYTANDAKRSAHSLVLLDVGAELNGYCADITRTYAWGKPTKRARQLHEALCSAQEEIIKMIGPYLSFAEYQSKVDEIMKTHMKEVGLIQSGDDARYRTYFPHAVSHGLGIDVHDSLGEGRMFEPGMVVTVEPGLYDTKEGIGLRIEDNVLITKSGHENLSSRLSTALA